MAAKGKVTHTLGPVYDGDSRILVLGSFPSPLSRETGFYYGNPRNRFWQVLSRLWDEPLPEGTQARREFCLGHRVALWDVLASCTIEGASDASIEDPVANDIPALLARTQVEGVFCTGTTAARLYRRLVQPAIGLGCTCLPSTSPANARMGFEDLVTAYEALREVADGT